VVPKSNPPFFIKLCRTCYRAMHDIDRFFILSLVHLAVKGVPDFNLKPITIAISGVARLLKVGGQRRRRRIRIRIRRRRVARCRTSASTGWGMGRGFPPPQPTRGMGERRKLPQRGAENEFGALWGCQKATGGNHYEYSVMHVLHYLAKI